MVRALGHDRKNRVMDAISRNVVAGHPRGVWSRATAPPHQEKGVEVAQGSGQDASWTSYWGGVPGTSNWEEAPGLMQDKLCWPGNTLGCP